MVHEVEKKTADLFPRIHSTTREPELLAYQRHIGMVVGGYIGEQGCGDFLKDARVLEVGCGGRASGIRALSCFRPGAITAVDLSGQNVKRTKELCRGINMANAAVMQANAMCLPFKDSSFDVVFSNGVIHHAVDTHKCFEEITRVTRPSGHVAIGMYAYGGIWGNAVHPLVKCIGRHLPMKHAEKFVNRTGLFQSQNASFLDFAYTPVQNTYSKAELENWFARAGFDHVSVITSPKWFYNLGVVSRLLAGEGYLFAIGRKTPN